MSFVLADEYQRMHPEDFLSFVGITGRKPEQLLGDISPATLSRLTKLVGAKIISFGQARASTYARPRDLPGIGHQLPVRRKP